MRQETRPWGRFKVLYEDESTWLKRIIIAPGQSLSYQYHLERDEFWKAETKGVWYELNGTVQEMNPDWASPVQVWKCKKHRLFNPGNAEVSVLEWCTGRPTEDDIIRIRDDYGRAM